MTNTYTTILSSSTPPPTQHRSLALSTQKSFVGFCQLLSASVSLCRLLSFSSWLCLLCQLCQLRTMRVFDECLSSWRREPMSPEPVFNNTMFWIWYNRMTRNWYNDSKFVQWLEIDTMTRKRYDVMALIQCFEFNIISFSFADPISKAESFCRRIRP